MGASFARPLNSEDLAFQFLTDALSIDEESAADFAMDIMEAEIGLDATKGKPTLYHRDIRHRKYKSDDSRITLRRNIFDELRELSRLDNDEDISIGNGGAKPINPIKEDKKAFFISGLPASGKSKISSLIAEEYGAYIVDSDYAKRKFKEYKHPFGASILHEESTIAVFGSTDPKFSNELNLFDYCCTRGINMVIPKVGYNLESLYKLRDHVKSYGYSYHLTLVSVDREEACRRALVRYIETKRYVPLSIIFDGYANDPILTYYRVKAQGNWSSTGKVSRMTNDTIFVEGDPSNPACLFV